MKLKDTETTLVVLGAWNPSIIRPDWIAREIFNVPKGESESVTMEVAVIPGAPIKFRLRDVFFVPMKNRLVILPVETNEGTLQKIEDITIKILSSLPHTPITGLGENFEYFENSPSQEIQKLMEINDNLAERCEISFETLSSSITTNLNLGHCKLNLSRLFSPDGFNLKFNFHYDCKSSEEAIRVLKGSFVKNYRDANTISSSYELISK
jgi:hypothetical protein